MINDDKWISTMIFFGNKPRHMAVAAILAPAAVAACANLGRPVGPPANQLEGLGVAVGVFKRIGISHGDKWHLAIS